VKPQVADAIEQHRRAGREFEAGGVRSFVREEGDGDPVVLMHGIPVSSFLYRKVLPLLAERGLRSVAFDLPGLGLAAKPGAFD
jgi:haloalkane dehalogenase